MQSNMTTSSELRSLNNSNGTGTSNNISSADVDSKKSEQKTSKNVLIKLKSYLIALRVWSLSASIIPTILGEDPLLRIYKYTNSRTWYSISCDGDHTSWSVQSIFPFIFSSYFLRPTIYTPYIYINEDSITCSSSQPCCFCWYTQKTGSFIY